MGNVPMLGIEELVVEAIQLRRHAGGGIEPFIISFTYVLAFSTLAVIVLVKTKFNNHLRIGCLTVTALAFFFLQGGHLIPLITRVLGSEGVRAVAGEVGRGHIATYSVPLAIVALALTLALTFVSGRAVCGYGCPVGAVQELLYDVPTGRKGKCKLNLPTRVAFPIRLGVLGIIVGLYLAFGLDLIQVISPYQLWRLEFVIPGLFIIIAFFASSPFIYRPFCRLACPYGAVASLVAKFSILKMEKIATCTKCGLCDKKCPTGEINDKFGECYLCGRCIRTCNVNAIKFR
jgi:polyferredoxin